MDTDKEVCQKISKMAASVGLDIEGGDVLRTSSRFCLGVEHGDYNGTELFGVGTDRYIWLGAKSNGRGEVRLISANFPDDDIISYTPGQTPPLSAVADSWARFPFGVDVVLRAAGYSTSEGFDAVLYGNIPGGGMSRSASLTINLILNVLEMNGHAIPEGMRVVELAQKVENEYIGSPCGNLDQIMIYFAKEGMGTHYNPRDQSIRYVPYGGDSDAFRIVSMDTGTNRPGLEKSTYKIRREECDRFLQMLSDDFDIGRLGDVRDESMYRRILERYKGSHADLVDRLRYIYEAQNRFDSMLKGWEQGNIAKVGKLFRQDGHGLRDAYKISGPELESMCDIARTVPGVLGERMLGGGDKGAAGAIVETGAVGQLKEAVTRAYPLCHPDYADAFAVHDCRVVDGVRKITGSARE